jgi:AraC family transcriptional regulator, regulatory protein of adaptative response / DNA-3-methyladenine glycosylase II
VRSILGQQITVKAARTLARRFVQQFGTTIETPFDGVDRLFPAAEAVAQYSPADIGALGIVSQRARAIVALARAVVDDALLLTPGTDVERALAPCGHYPASANGLRNTSRCGLCTGPTRSR